MAGRKSAMYGGGGDTALTPVVLPATVGNAVAGYSPELLDELISTLIRNAEDGARLIAEHKPALHNLMHRLQAEITTVLSMIPQATEIAAQGTTPARIETQGLETALRLADKVTLILDRVNKMGLNSVKSIDDGTRLRKDLATGDTERKRLEDLGEQQLRKIIAQANEGNFKSDGV